MKKDIILAGLILHLEFAIAENFFQCVIKS